MLGQLAIAWIVPSILTIVFSVVFATELIAQESTDNRMAMLTVLAGLVGGAVVWLWNAFGAKRKTTISEWIDIANAKDARIDYLQQELTKVQERCTKSEVAEARCQGQMGALQAEMRHWQDQLRRLQAKMGDLPPGVTPPSEIIADMNGVIRWASASVGSMFHYLPQELIGKNISVLMPAEMRPLHKRAMELMINSKRVPDPLKPIGSFALTKDGRRFPVSINLSGWESEPGKMFINAEIRSVGDSDVFSLPVGPPDGTVNEPAQPT